MQNITDKIASTHLGKRSTGSEQYDASLLVVVPREENRKIYDIDKKNLPFVGFDVWHAYEFSVLTQKGLPVTRLMKLKYNCDNEYLMVEIFRGELDERIIRFTPKGLRYEKIVGGLDE